MSEDRLEQLVSSLAGRRVLVVGDLVLDEYVVGRPARVSREAPVLVLEYGERFCRAGAAANPACNIRALGSEVEALGIVGADDSGRQLLDLLASAGIGVAGAVVAPGQITATKTRLLAEDPAGHRQQLLRVDRLPPATLDRAVERELLDRLQRLAASADAILLSDYKGGVVGPALVAAAADLGRQRGIPVTVDTQGDLLRFRGLTLVKANLADAEASLGTRLTDDDDLRRAGERLVREVGARYVVITRGAAGLTAVDAAGACLHVPADRTEVRDVTGAGDTVIAVLTLALLAGASLAEAARLANHAAGLVVRRLGVATVSPAELVRAARAAGTWG